MYVNVWHILTFARMCALIKRACRTHFNCHHSLELFYFFEFVFNGYQTPNPFVVIKVPNTPFELSIVITLFYHFFTSHDNWNLTLSCFSPLVHATPEQQDWASTHSIVGNVSSSGGY